MRVCDAHAVSGGIVRVSNREGGELLAKYDGNVTLQVTLCAECAAQVLEFARRFIGLGVGKVRL
jgi:hypothetical protein